MTGTKALSLNNSRGSEMLRSIKEFLRDERGNVTIESLVVLGGSVWMAMVVVSDITFAAVGVSNRIENQLEYSSIINQILDSHGPDSEQAGGSDGGSGGGSGSDDEVDCVGNPGNDKCVGNAGENPNGGDDWGSGSNGMSDSGSSSGNSGGGRGNSGNAPGRNK